MCNDLGDSISPRTQITHKPFPMTLDDRQAESCDGLSCQQKKHASPIIRASKGMLNWKKSNKKHSKGQIDELKQKNLLGTHELQIEPQLSSLTQINKVEGLPGAQTQTIAIQPSPRFSLSGHGVGPQLVSPSYNQIKLTNNDKPIQ